MTTLYMVRHGETEWNAEGRYQGHMDPPLNENGRQQARATAKKLAGEGITAIYSSDLARAHQTAQAMEQESGLPLHLDVRLREINQGDWEGVLGEDIRARWPALIDGWESDPWNYHPPGGETLQQVQSRLHEAIDEIIARHPTDRIAIFSHKLPIALLKIRYKNFPAQEIWSLLPANGAWELFEIEPIGEK